MTDLDQRLQAATTKARAADGTINHLEDLVDELTDMAAEAALGSLPYIKALMVANRRCARAGMLLREVAPSATSDRKRKYVTEEAIRALHGAGRICIKIIYKSTSSVLVH